MDARNDRSVAVCNRDINPSDQMAAAYPGLACLVRNDAISDAFAGFEKTALRWKRFYVFFGRLSLIAVLLAMVSFDYQITLKTIYGAPAFLPGFAATFGAVGLISQLLLGMTRAKDRWLAARFAAERLRCFKFQLFHVLEEVADADGLADRVQQRTHEGLAALEQELMGGHAAISEFSPVDVPIASQRKSAHTSRKLIEEGLKVYDSLRFSVEIQHFEEQFQHHNRKTRLPSLLSEFSFLAGAILACIGIFTTVLPEGMPLFHVMTNHVVMEWVDFLTWLLFVISAVLAIYERGSAHQPNAERYMTYVREIRRLRSHAPSHMPVSFFDAVRDMERLMLREIQDFCRDVNHSNYIF